MRAQQPPAVEAQAQVGGGVRGRRVVVARDTAADTLEQATQDAPEPVRETVRTVAETVRQTGGQFPVCP